MTTFTIEPRGPFALAELARFGFGYRSRPSFDGVLRMAFGTDDHRGAVAVAVTQDDGGVHVDLVGDADPDAVRRQVSRVLSLDHDGRLFTAIGLRDPVIGRLQRVAPGLRPPQFYSAYDAAMWSVLSARRPAEQMAQVRQRLSEAHGTVLDVAGQPVAAFPTPAQMLRVETFAGLPPVKFQRMHTVARAALDGALDTGALSTADPAAAAAGLQTLPGIGPFYSSLILIRGCGRADLLPESEPRSLAAVGRLYGYGRPVTGGELTELARAWQPLPTWAVVLIRAASARLDSAA